MGDVKRNWDVRGKKERLEESSKVASFENIATL